ncbi:unnamed protein product [Prunus armeniaca]
MSTTSQNSDPLPIFMGENYDFWSIKMKTYFMSQDLWDIVDSGFNNPENSTVEQLRQLKKDQQKDAKALYALQQALHDMIFPIIMGATTAREAWNTLKEEFQGNAKTKDLTSLSVTEVMGSLEAYEKRMSRRNEKSVESAFQSKLNLRSQKTKEGERKIGEISRK